MGHFGRTAIRLGWLAVTLPALMLNYLGQGAVLLRDPTALANPFYALAPPGFHYPLVALATVATVIASQAVISGVFSITRQSVQLGQLPRMEIRHTSATDYGQIYVPRANTLMLIGVVAIVLIYKNSDALAAAYGMAVTGMMSITTFLGLIVVIGNGIGSRSGLPSPSRIFILTDLTFLGAVSLKLVEGALAAARHRRGRVHHDGNLAVGTPRAPGKSLWRRHFAPTVSWNAPTRRRSASPAPRSSSRRASTKCRARCCTISSTIRCCMSA